MSRPFGHTYSARHRRPSEAPPILEQLRTLGRLQAWTISHRDADRLLFTCSTHKGCLVLMDTRFARTGTLEALLEDLFSDTCWKWEV